MARGKSLDSVREALLRSDPEFRRAWEADRLKRSVALALVRMRRSAGLTQSVLALATGWDKAFVSRMESATGGVPDSASIARYCEACGASASLLLVKTDAAGRPDVVIVPLGADTKFRTASEALRNTPATMIAAEPAREEAREPARVGAVAY